jgi:hypothetical protein
VVSAKDQAIMSHWLNAVLLEAFIETRRANARYWTERLRSLER